MSLVPMLCLLARFVARSLERSGQTSLRLQLVGTSWSLSLVKKSPRGARSAKNGPAVPTAVPITSDGPTGIGTGDGSPAFVLTDLGKEYLAAIA